MTGRYGVWTSETLTLESLLGGAETAQFLAENWQRSCSVFYGGRATDFLQSLSDLDALAVRQAAQPEQLFRLVNKEGGLPRSSFTGDGTIKFRELAQRLKTGYSLIFNRLQHSEPDVARACYGLSTSLNEHGILLSREVGANLYVTGPSSQCFPRHIDLHDVFVIQLRGRKSWTVFQPPQKNIEETASSGKESQHDEVAVFQVTLEEGQVLYVPKGFPHEVITTDCESVHLTLSLYPVTWGEIATLLIGRSEAMRTAIPRLQQDGGASAKSGDFAETLKGIACQNAVNAVIADLQLSFLPNLRGLASGWIDDALGGVNAFDACFVRNPGIAAQVLEESDGTVTLQYSGGEFSASTEWRKLFDFLVETDCFRLDQIPDGGSEAVARLLEQLAADGLFWREPITPQSKLSESMT